MGEAEELRACRTDLQACIRRDQPRGTIHDALRGADVFIGLSIGNVLDKADLERMNPDRIVFAMANPDPEIDPKVGDEVSRIFATGRSDFPNQINNALSFPGIFRGALDIQASEINEAMKLAAAQAIAECVPTEALSEDYIIPSVFDRDVVPRVAILCTKDPACVYDLILRQQGGGLVGHRWSACNCRLQRLHNRR